MTIAIALKREFEFVGNDLNNDPCLFPRNTNNETFVQAFNFKTQQISGDSSGYAAFPYVIRIGLSIVGIYSDGESHAASARQIMIRSDDNGATWQSVEFYNNSTGVFNFSLLVGLLASGQKAVFKVWTVFNNGGTFSATAQSTVSYGGLTYALWSRVTNAPDGKLWRTGYATNGGNQQSALFESSDNGTSWSGKSIMFSGTGFFNESDLVNTTGSTWIAYCREDGGVGNPIYKSVSTDDGATWGASTLIDTALISGRQPNLTKLSDGSIILATGDRFGVSGYSGGGSTTNGFDTTGITIFRSTDNGDTWSFRTRISATFSTDGGQPMVIETTAGRILVVFYRRDVRPSTPMIASCSLDVANL